MLILSRKLGEKITVDGEIELEVLEISGNKIRLGISAPQRYRIARAETMLDKTRRVDEPAERGSRPAETLARAGA